MPYLINWEWGGLERNMTHTDFEGRVESFGSWTGFNELFDLKTARDEWLDPDPRLRWLRKAILKQPIVAGKEEEQLQLQTKGDDPTTTMTGPVPLLQSLKGDDFLPNEAAT